MDVRSMRNAVLGARVVNALKSRNMDAYYVETKEEAVAKALELMPKGSTISWGGTMSVAEAGLMDAIRNGDYMLYDRDQADYVYESEKLATLAGKKLHGKRNHINKFQKLYPNWSYEPLNDENMEECFQMALKWRNQNGCEEDPGKNAEMCVALNALRLYKELDQRGGVLRVDGQVVAFTIGEELCEDTFVVHIEKAFADIDGAYPMINQQFVQHECTGYQYVNREDDAGSEGLRKAKLSYRPAFLVEKGILTRKNA